MATQSRGNGTNFGWLKKSCDISTCDLSPNGNPEKYGRPMKSAISTFQLSPPAVSQVHMTATIFIYIQFDELGALKHAIFCRFVTLFHLFD